MLGKKAVEEIATGAVRNYFNLCKSISPQIQENDKSPDWDGFLYLYEPPKDVRNNYFGSIRIQVKGKQVSSFKNRESYKVEKVFLKNSLNEGCIFFVVEVKNDGSTKIFYKMLAPIEIRGELAKLGKTQKTHVMKFEPLGDDRAFLEIQFRTFYYDCYKQKSFASGKEFRIENLKNVTEYQWGFSYQGKNVINDFLAGFKSFLYAKTKDGITIPVGNSPVNIVIPELRSYRKNSVYVGDYKVSEGYDYVVTKSKTIFQIGNMLKLEMMPSGSSQKQTITLNIISSSTNDQIEAYNLLLRMVEHGSIKFGDIEIPIILQNKKEIVSEIRIKLTELEQCKAVLDVLQIKTDINYDAFTDNDSFSVHQLYKSLINHIPVGLNNPQNLFRLKFANINVLLVAQSNGDGKFYLTNAFTSPLLRVSQNSDGKPFDVPIFSVLEQNGYVLFDNIPYDSIVDSYKRYAEQDKRVYNQANLDLLQMLKAVDELKDNGHNLKSDFTLKAAKFLAEWIADNDKDEQKRDIHQLNCLQIIKRLREFTDVERNNLLSLTQSNSVMTRAAAYLLLGEQDFFLFTFNKMSDEDKKLFTQFPIYVFSKFRRRE